MNTTENTRPSRLTAKGNALLAKADAVFTVRDANGTAVLTGATSAEVDGFTASVAPALRDNITVENTR